MGTTADKLNAILEAKQAIKQAIRDKGVYIGDLDPLDYYPTAIGLIETSSSNPDENNPYQQLYMQRTANETSMKGLFAYTPASTTLDLSVVNTSQVTDMSYMFSECKVPYLDLSGFDMNNVTNMNNMFYYCTSEINIDGWDTNKLTNASYMFGYFTNGGKYLDLSILDFSNVTKTDSMFGNCNLNNIDIRNINIDLAKLDWNAYNGPNFLYQCKGATLDLSNWTLDSSMTNLKKLCNWCYCTEINLTNWKTTNITNMQEMFYYNTSLERLIIPDWDMTNVTNTSNFFYNCSKLNYIDLSRSNDATISKIATLVPAQKLATYGQILIPADSSQANIDALVAKYWKPVGPRIDMTSCEIITELDEIKPGKSTKFYYGNSEPWYGNDANVEYVSSDESIATIDKDTMTITSTGVEGTTEITARIADTQEVISKTPITLAVSEIDNYPNVVKIKRNSANSGNITINGATKNINSCFIKNNISGVWTYDVGAPITSFNFGNSGEYVSELVKINTSNMTTMESMFYGCKNLITLDLSDWDTSNITGMNGMSSMFANCTSLEKLDIRNFNMANVTSVFAMFSGCNNLQELRLDNCSNDTISRIIKQASLPTNTIEGITRKIYCKQENAAGLIAPTNWIFEFIE